MKLEWTDPALAHRAAIWDYIAIENPRAAVELDEYFSRTADRLCRYPEMGRPGRVSGTREVLVRTRYTLVYELADDVVRVLAIMHTARQWPPVAE